MKSPGFLQRTTSDKNGMAVRSELPADEKPPDDAPLALVYCKSYSFVAYSSIYWKG